MKPLYHLSLVLSINVLQHGFTWPCHNKLPSIGASSKAYFFKNIFKGSPHTWKKFCKQAHSFKILKDMDF